MKRHYEFSLRKSASSAFQLVAGVSLRTLAVGLGLLSILWIAVPETVKAIPPSFNVQGRLTDSTGVNRDGTFSLKFTLFDMPTAGNNLWSRSYPAVTVRNGQFQLALADPDDTSRLLANVLTSANVFLEIQVTGGLGISLPEPPLVPRQQLASVPFAFQSGGIVSAAAATVVVGGAEQMRVTSDGKVGIGTTNPASKLTVLDGDIHISTTTSSRGIIFQDGSVQTSAATGGGGFSAGKLNVVVGPGASPANQVSITADFLDVGGVRLSITTPLTVAITASGANGLDAGSRASNTWYSVWVITNDAGSTIDALLSTSATAPTLPSGFTKKRRVGWVRTGTFNEIIQTFRQGDWVWYTSNVAMGRTFAVTAPTTIPSADFTFAIPPTSFEGSFSIVAPVASNTAFVVVSVAVTGTPMPAFPVIFGFADAIGHVILPLNRSQQMDISVAGSPASPLLFRVTGYYDPV